MPFVAFDLQGTLCNYEKVIQAIQVLFNKQSQMQCEQQQQQENITKEASLFFETWYHSALLDYIAISQSGKYQPLVNVLQYTLPRTLLCKGLSEPAQEDADTLLKAFDQVEPFKNVVKVMEMLKRENWDIWILSNGDVDSTVKLLDRMKLLDYVGENILCCDELRLAKPHPKIYSELMRLAVHRTKRIESFYLIGSYSWEVASAKNISLKSVFLNTNEKVFPSELYGDVKPDVIGTSLLECTTKIIDIENARKKFIQ